MCHRFTMLTPDEIDRILAHLRAVARLMDAGALDGMHGDACALPPLHRPRDIRDIDAFPGSECQVIIVGAPTADAAQEAALRKSSRVFHVKHSDKGGASDACLGRTGTPNANARDGATEAPSARALAERTEAAEAKSSSEAEGFPGTRDSTDTTPASFPAEVSPVRMFHVKHPSEGNAAKDAPPDDATEGTPPGSVAESPSPGATAKGSDAGDGGDVGAVERAASSATEGGAEGGGAVGAASGGADGDARGGVGADGPLSAMAAQLGRATLAWGIDVPWKTGLVFNTRIESALGGSAMWRDALAEGRCLVPVRAFFETRNVEPPSGELPLDGEADASSRAGRGRRPQFRFASPGGEALLLAGLRQGDRFTVVTTEPNGAVAPVHSRMPVALSPAEALVWLTGTADELATLADRARIALESAEQPRATRAKAPDPDQLSLF